MKKLKLFGIKKNKKQVEFTIEKSQEFVPLIQNLVKKLTGEVDWQLFVGTDKKTGKCVDEKIEDWTDRYKHRKYKNYELDIFIGKNRIILVTRSSIQNQKRFIDELMNFCKWKKKVIPKFVSKNNES